MGELWLNVERWTQNEIQTKSSGSLADFLCVVAHSATLRAEYNDDQQVQLATCCTPREVIGSLNQPKAAFRFGDHPSDSNLVSLRLASRNAQYAQPCRRSARPHTALASASTFHRRLPNARFISTYRRRNVCVVRPEVFLPRADRRSLPVKVPGHRKARIWFVFHGVALQRPCVSHKEIASLWLMIENMQASIAMC